MIDDSPWVSKIHSTIDTAVLSQIINLIKFGTVDDKQTRNNDFRGMI